MHAALARLVKSEEARKQEKIDQIPLPETPLTEQRVSTLAATHAQL